MVPAVAMIILVAKLDFALVFFLFIDIFERIVRHFLDDIRIRERILDRVIDIQLEDIFPSASHPIRLVAVPEKPGDLKLERMYSCPAHSYLKNIMKLNEIEMGRNREEALDHGFIGTPESNEKQIAFGRS